MNKIRLSYQVVIVVHHITAFVLIGRKIPCLQSVMSYQNIFIRFHLLVHFNPRKHLQALHMQ